MLLIWLSYTSLLFICGLSAENSNNISSENVLQMLIDCGGNVASLRNELQEIKDQSDRLSSRSTTTTYTRWGRRSCPARATLVYDGFAAGSYNTHSGAAANHICMSKTPKWKYHYSNPNDKTYIYGAEYQTDGSIWKHLYQHEVPCAVCRVPRSSVIMVPGTYDCPGNYLREYSGYIMAGHHTHKAATEFVCVDSNAEKAEYSSVSNNDGTLFYFVQAGCGALKCEPYIKNKQITCAVCSYSP